MAAEVFCAQCDQPESQCQCDKYCALCKSWDSVTLCADGQYYCSACREACDYAPANPERS